MATYGKRHRWNRHGKWQYNVGKQCHACSMRALWLGAGVYRITRPTGVSLYNVGLPECKGDG